MMKLRNKQRRLGWLMIISQLMLVGFSFYWLNSQYMKAREDLWIDVKTSYMESHDMVMDSLLVQHYIRPALGDTLEPTVAIAQYSGTGERIQFGDKGILRVKGDSAFVHGNVGETTVSIHLVESDSSRISREQLAELEKQMLLKSIRLIVKHVDDSLEANYNSIHNLNESLDTALFISDFETRIIDEGISGRPVWLSKSSKEDRTPKNDRVIIVGGFNDNLPSVELRTYRPYLISKILPQILFALVLVFITALSFILAYRSLRKQTILNEMRNSFIGNISHELKTPVSTVKVAIEAIRNFDLKKEGFLASEYLDMAAKEIKRLELLITKVLDNTIIEQDQAILHFENADLVEIVKTAIDSMLPKIKDSNAEVNFEDLDPVYLEVDPLYLQGVIINLIDNSLKYGNGNPILNLSLQTNDKEAILKISDNGPGIPDQYKVKVFDKFFRIPASDTHNVKGYGLGLSFAALIVKMHNGSIGVKNNKVGCTFTISIPKTRS